MSLPFHKRYEIVFLHEHPDRQKLEYKEITKILKCSRGKLLDNRWKENDELKLAEKVKGPTCSTIQSEIEEKGITLVYQ